MVILLQEQNGSVSEFFPRFYIALLVSLSAFGFIFFSREPQAKQKIQPPWWVHFISLVNTQARAYIQKTGQGVFRPNSRPAREKSAENSAILAYYDTKIWLPPVHILFFFLGILQVQ